MYSKLSESILWSKMEEYYQHFGPELWETNIVPYAISSSKLLAHIYANLIIAQLQDHVKNEKTDSPTEDIIILELGAGHGQFGFYLTQKLIEQFNILNWDNNKVKYILTDISEENKNSWKQHPKFQDLASKGNVDFATFNPLTANSLVSDIHGISIGNGCSNAPVFVVGNYFFDSLKQDAFEIQNGKISEVLINVDASGPIKSIFENSNYKFKRQEISADSYYSDTSLNSVLKYYQNNLQEGTLLLPVGAIECMKNLSSLSSSNVAFLIGDKGETILDALSNVSDPEISQHGSISLMVNFHAIKLYHELNEGFALTTVNASENFQLSFFLNRYSYDLSNTRKAFHDLLSITSPDDLYNLFYNNYNEIIEYKSLDQYIALLKLSDWDPNIFYEISSELSDLMEDIDIVQENTITNGLIKVEDYFFKVEKETDVFFEIGNVLYSMARYEDALRLFQKSEQMFSENKEINYNLALCYVALDEIALAKKHLKICLQDHPGYELAKELEAEIS